MATSGFTNFIDCAALKIYALPGATIQVTNGIISKTLGIDDVFEIEAGQKTYIIYIQEKNFGTWTVISTIENTDRQKSITINKFSLYTISLILPNEYQQVEYIQSSGTQYINLDITPTNTMKFQVKFMSLATTGNVIFGAHAGSDVTDYRIFNDSSKLYFDIPGGSSAGNRLIGATNSCVINTIYNFELGNWYVKDLITNQYVVYGNSINFSPAATTIKLNKGSESSGFAKTNWYYVISYDNDIITHKFYPACRISDSVLGMYDVITDTFYTNSGSGSFTSGAPIENNEQPLQIFLSGIGSCIPVTYGAETNASISVNRNNITTNYTSDGGYQIVYFNSEPIDLLRYSKLVVVSSLTTRSTSADYGGIAFVANGVPSAGGTHSASHVIASTALSTGGTNQITTVNLNSITTTGYVGVRGGMKGTISQIYLI